MDVIKCSIQKPMSCVLFFPSFSEFGGLYDVMLDIGNLKEACKLLEIGFEYVTDIDGKKLFGKRK